MGKPYLVRHSCSIDAAWIPAFAGMTAIGRYCHSREGGNPCLLRKSDGVYLLTERQCPLRHFRP